ncbi:MAG: NAD(P)-dependent oxidoreductase [Gemmatimonadetes bacterium]|nr:NAD(P)-dependent oxidoreductase [Gemmatimonadota bacterium]
MRSMPRFTGSAGPRSLEAYRGRRVLVFGASGFIGRWVAATLVREGADARLVARSSEGEARIRSWPGLANATIVNADLTDAASVHDLVRSTRPAVTFNAVGHGVDPDERDDDTAFAVNERGVITLCDAVADGYDPEWHGQRIVHIGSSAEYGQTDAAVCDDSPPAPLTLYGRSKLAGTLAFSARCATHSLRGVAARLFLVYGRGEHEHRLFPSLIRAVAGNRPIALSDGTQRLDFTWVGDVAEWLLRLGLSAAERGEVVNLATGRLTAVRTFVEIVASLLHLDRALLRFGEAAPRPHEVRYGPVSTVRLRALTGGAPATTIVQGIRTTLEGAGLSV